MKVLLEPVSINVEQQSIAGSLLLHTPAVPGVLFVHGWGGSQEQYITRAREVAEYRGRKRREQRQASNSRQTLDQLLQTREAGEKRLLPLVLKTDVQGSSEAIQGSLAKLGTAEVGAQILPRLRRGG